MVKMRINSKRAYFGSRCGGLNTRCAQGTKNSKFRVIRVLVVEIRSGSTGLGVTMRLRWITAVAAMMCAVQGFSAGIDYEKFLGRHDMVWDRIPNRWEVSPYTGNGNVGVVALAAGIRDPDG